MITSYKILVADFPENLVSQVQALIDTPCECDQLWQPHGPMNCTTTYIDYQYHGGSEPAQAVHQIQYSQAMVREAQL